MKIAFTMIISGAFALTGCQGKMHRAADLSRAPLVRLASNSQGQVPLGAQYQGHVAANQNIRLSVGLHLNNEAELHARLNEIYTPGSPQYQKYLSPQEFAAQFGPKPADVATVSNYLQSQGLRVTNVHSNRTLINVEGSAADVERAFQLKLNQYHLADGSFGFQASDAPAVPSALISHVAAVVGLSNLAKADRPHPAIAKTSAAGLSPSDVKKAYQMDTMSETGAGQTIALVEYYSYYQSDITAFATDFGLTVPHVSQVLVDGADGVPSTFAGFDQELFEVTSDIQVILGMAPGASILVYEAGLGDEQSTLDLYNKIATDNIAKVISNSWGKAESSVSPATLAAENAIFMQMAAQGQTFFSASGDSGGGEMSDPPSQPYVVAVGGTLLSLDSNGNYLSETTMNSLRPGWGPFASGGGISGVWPIPQWQIGLGNAVNGGSSTMRMIPDVALNGDLRLGYKTILRGQLALNTGTSMAAPIWAAFAALVNERRGHSLGYLNPALYQIASQCSSCFHDVSDGSTNGSFSAVPGYDLATGLGSMNGANLAQALVGTLPSISSFQLAQSPPAPNPPASIAPGPMPVTPPAPQVQTVPPSLPPVPAPTPDWTLLASLAESTGSSCSQAGVGFLISNQFSAQAANASDVEFVTSLYLALLNRFPDSAGLAGWMAALNSQTLTRTQVADGFLQSLEFNWLCINRYGFPGGAGTYAFPLGTNFP